MVISDTDEHSFDGATMPQVDNLIYTGDVTNFGDLNALKECIKMMGTFEAELKLVIAGDCDISLGKTCRVENMSKEEYSKFHEAVLGIMVGSLAQEAGVSYLEEGTHTFTISNGAKSHGLRFAIHAWIRWLGFLIRNLSRSIQRRRPGCTKPNLDYSKLT